MIIISPDISFITFHFVHSFAFYNHLEMRKSTVIRGLIHVAEGKTAFSTLLSG